MQTGLCRMRTESLTAPSPRSGKRFLGARDRRPRTPLVSRKTWGPRRRIIGHQPSPRARGDHLDRCARSTFSISLSSRLPKISGICIAPLYVADELLRAEGFTDIRFVESLAGAVVSKLARREV